MLLNFAKNKHYLKYKFNCGYVLKQTLSQFFNANIEFIENDFNNIFELYGIEKRSSTISDKQRVFIISKDKILLLPRIYCENKEIAFYAILIDKQGIGANGNDFKIYNTIESTLTRNFSFAFDDKFENAIQLFDDNLIKRAIALYFCKGNYHPSKVIYLIDYLNRLRTTSFEGNFFSTGMILTKSDKNFVKDDKLRLGKSATLTKSVNISKSELDRRFWYLADGKTSFFLCNRLHSINCLFTLDYNFVKDISYIDKLLLKQTLKGGDALFRVENEKEISIITSNEKEFIYSENHWKYRDYNIFKQLITSKVELKNYVFEHLLFYILYCSKNRVSSIIWIPQNLSEIDQYLKSKNKTIRNNIELCDTSYSNLIIRYLSSDGAVVIGSEGKVLYYGCIIDMGAIKIKGVKGTGESAAGILCDNGISIKISQDGTIKLFLIKNRKPILL